MNVYQSVSLKKLKNVRKNAGFGAITLQYLPFLVRDMSPKYIFSSPVSL